MDERRRWWVVPAIGAAGAAIYSTTALDDFVATLGGRVKTGHFVDSQNRPLLAGVETA